jgi:methyl-accepting chemotaxis protein
MSKKLSKKAGKQKGRISIKHKVFVFSIILFLVIFVTGSIAFVLSMLQITYHTSGQELAKEIEIERIKLETSVNSEIAIAMKMADSPLIQRYFANPYDAELERIAFEEIAGYRRAFAGNTVFWVNDIDHRFYSDDSYAFTIDVTDPDNYWYLMTLNETEVYNFNINYNPDLDSTDLWINAPVFDSTGRPIGILGTSIDLTSFIDSIYRNYTGTAELYFFNSLNEITGARDTSLVANKVTLDNHLGEKGEEIFSRSRNLRSEEFIYFSAGGAEIALGGVPALEWYITAIQTVELTDTLDSSMTVLFLAMITVIAVIFIIFYVYITRLLKPMNYLVEVLDKTSSDWDMTRRFQLHRRDEIGTLGDFFNLTFDKMMGLLLGIKKKTAALSGTGEELTSKMEVTKNDIEKVNETIHGMMKKVLSQADKVNSTTSTIEQIIKGLGDLNEHISVQAANVSQSSSSIEEMLANIQSVTQTLVKNTANINSLAESSEAGRADLQKVSADIQEIARESEGLLQINAVMENIASQTNLLSMNAAIEAAHAGEAGKGFAVVAAEIRKLAENSGAQSKTISDVLKRIKNSIDTITRSTNVVLDRFETIEQEVETVANMETQIRNAMEEQGVGSRQILEAVTQLNSVTNLVRKASSEMAEESQDVLKQSGELRQITNEVAGSMDDMFFSADEISNAITRVQEIAGENRENINELSTEVARFKVE